jgi:peptidyl-dipeptidase A
MELDFITLIDSLEQKIKPVETGVALADFNAAVTGRDEEYKKSTSLNITLSKIYADPVTFSRIKAFREGGKIKDSLLNRELTVLYNLFLGYQVDEQKLEELIRAKTALEQKYATFRARVDGKKVTDNAIEEVLKTSVRSSELEKYWRAGKQVGDSVAADVIALVRLRNQIARELGFRNYHDMSLRLSDQDPVVIESIFNELDSLTRDSFITLKSQMDSILASRYKLNVGDLMPWHYQNRFFQEAPAIYEVNLDSYFADKDVVALSREYFKGIGLDAGKILENSDLFEREGKYQHAFCTHIDRSGDVRVVCNVRNNSQWMGTMLHELGHGVYDQNIDRTLPYFLRTPAHTFTTEAIAMIFGRLVSNPAWLNENAGVSMDEAKQIAPVLKKNLQLEQLVFSRWCQVMFRFEKSLYENPDQDLSKKWWELVEQYQMIQNPGGNHSDWASKIHVALYPCYYHNYQLGELLASQLQAHITKVIFSSHNKDFISYSHSEDMGEYLLNNVFRPGARHQWNEMIQRATGEELTARYFAEEFIK